jgi:ubiquinone/menaquinone biosynthesis C-methylase UbiE
MSFLSPEQSITALRLHPGDRVIDFGCGSGAYARAAESLVTSSGVVYAVDSNQELLRNLHTTDGGADSSMQTIWEDLDAHFVLPIPTNSVDAIVLSNILSLLEDTEFVMVEIVRTLKAEGKILVVDWKTESPLVTPAQVYGEEQLRRLCDVYGFEIEQSVPAGDHHFAYILRRVANNT